MRYLFTVALCASLAGVALAQESRIIRIKPTLRINLSTEDDIAHLKQLAAGVGWEFSPNAETTAGLKRIGIKRMRCINVDPLPGSFDEEGQFHVDVEKRCRLDAHLDTCRAIGAMPHVIIATGLHPDLRVEADDLDTTDERVLGLLRERTFGPNNWPKFRSCIKAYFEYVIITNGFGDAAFEVANEPDIGGAIVSKPPKPPMGSRRLYEEYLNLYRNVAQAAAEFEVEHPGLHVTLGGPALAWAYSFTYGDFNWTERFLADVQREKLKLDFIGLHYYGNISPLTGLEKRANYPSFSEMVRMTRDWRDLYTPGVPMYFSEWGASYHTNLTEGSLHNASNVGASFAAAFLNQMLIDGVEKALYLVTTDLPPQSEDQKKWGGVWGWPSLFTYSGIGTHPKAPYHVFQMVHRMAPHRVEVSNAGGTLGAIASADDSGRLTVLVWNHSHTIPEGGVGVETGRREVVVLRIADADRFFTDRPVRMERHLVSRSVSNALYLFQNDETLDERAELQRVDSGTFRCIEGMLDIGFAQPPSSVSFVELSPVPEQP